KTGRLPEEDAPNDLTRILEASAIDEYGRYVVTDPEILKSVSGGWFDSNGNCGCGSDNGANNSNNGSGNGANDGHNGSGNGNNNGNDDGNNDGNHDGNDGDGGGDDDGGDGGD
ncbi:hypothetical protein ACFOVS_16220, partial [Rhizobium lemnae]